MTVINDGNTAAMFVWVEDARDLTAPGYAYFGDNYFCLLPQESRSVSVTWKDVSVEEQRLEIAAWNSERHLLDGSNEKEMMYGSQ